MSTSLFANNLKFLRKMRGMSQQKLAEQLGLKRNNIASYEAGIVEPKAVNFLKLALFFSVSPSDLLEKNIARGIAPHGEHAAGEEEMAGQLRLFSGHTSDMQKVLEGFREFQKLNLTAGPSDPALKKPENKMLEPEGELDNLLSIMEQLLESNWKLIRAMTEERKE